MRSFVKKNWADFLALFTDIPGVTSAGALHFLVLTRFRHVLRVFRLARVLKIFRVSRMFRKTAQSKKMLDVMIYKPTFFMSGFLLVMILGFAIALKILEQHRNTTWASYGNVLWFSIVTVTTIGYGDMSPNTIGGRLVTTVMMALGIGMVGLLTATIIRSVLLGKSKGKIGQRKRERANRMEMLKTR